MPTQCNPTCIVTLRSSHLLHDCNLPFHCYNPNSCKEYSNELDDTAVSGGHGCMHHLFAKPLAWQQHCCCSVCTVLH